jgi:hypothetical protein
MRKPESKTTPQNDKAILLAKDPNPMCSSTRRIKAPTRFSLCEEKTLYLEHESPSVVNNQKIEHNLLFYYELLGACSFLRIVCGLRSSDGKILCRSYIVLVCLVLSF